MAVDPYRLPTSVTPERYVLTLTPDLDAATFAGEVRIHLTAHEDVREIVCNAKNLTIAEAHLISDADGSIREATATIDDEYERVTFTLSTTAPKGAHVLHITFDGILNDRLCGFYRSTFKDLDGVERVLATTQMEATDARQAFPCWDEPEHKAVFETTLIVDDGLLAISNAAETGRTDLGNGKVEVRFAPTMKMSTYLVAFVVGPLEITDPVDVDGTPLRIAYPPGKGHLTAFGLEVGAAALRYFSQWFGIPYPGDKLDMIAIPDFAFGAMENLGCITYRETALLADPEQASRVELERVADVVNHEIAHMWFGDLVTMKWWNGIWLNEAFATFMEICATDAFKPDWQRWTSFSTERGAAQTIDSLAATRPIEFEVVSPDEAEGMFDVLTYQKGGSVLRMLQQYLGEQRFQEGIRLYLSKHLYANAETTDLWDAIEEATGEPVRSTMDSWIFQGGYPIISVELTEGANGADTAVRMSQRRFRYLPVPEDRAARWSVPILLRAGGGGEVEHHRVLVTDEDAVVELGAKPEWVVANSGASGFYRVRYSTSLLAGLTTGGQAALSATERYSLVSDTWAAVLAGLSPVTDFVELCTALKAEDDPDVWAAMTAPFAFLSGLLPKDERGPIEAFVRDLAGPAFERVGWTASPGESERIGTLRATLVRALGVTGADPKVREEATRLHAKFLEDRRNVDPNLAGPIVDVLADAGGEGDYETFLDRYRNPSTPQEEVRYLHALARFPYAPLTRRTVELCVNGEVRSQDAPYVIGTALANKVAGAEAWDRVKENWETIVGRFPSNALGRMLQGLAAQADAGLAADAKAFLADHPIPQAAKLNAQTLERLEVNAAFKARELPTLLQAFE